jgi:DNA-binding HxlR family transcriptional regulator
MPARRRTQRERNSERTDHQVCPAVKSIAKVGNELRLVVIRYLIDRPMRFNELMAAAKTIDPKSLSRVLKYLVAEGIVRREVLSTQPFMVQYSLTEKGMELKPVIDSLYAWGERWLMPRGVIVKNR